MAGLGVLVLRLLSQYLVQILAGLAVVVLYFVWAGHQQELGEERVKTAVAKRDADEKAQSEKLMNEAITRVTQARQEDQGNYDRTLKAYAQIIDSRNSVVRVRDKSTGKKSDNCPAAGQADVSQGSVGTDGRVSQEVPELAALCLLAAEEIRRTHTVK